MQSFKYYISIFLIALFFSQSKAQVNLKKAKNTITSTSVKKTNSNPCENNGTIAVSETSKAFTLYNNVVKQIEIAESFVSRGLAKSAIKNIANAERYLESLLKKEPDADITSLCQRISALKSNSQQSEGDDDYFSNISFFLGRYYSVAGTPSKPERFGFIYDDFINRSNVFNREATYSKIKTSNHRKAIEIKAILDDYSAFIDREGLVEYLMDKLDEVNSASPDQLIEMATTIKKVAIGLKNIAGENDSVNRLLDFTANQLSDADARMGDIFTSDFHKENIKKIVFSKEIYTPGNENSVDINPIFQSGDAIIATIYLPCSIKEAVSSWKGYGKGGTMALEVEDSNGDFLNRRFESWEVSSYSNYEVSIDDNTSKEQTYIQFVLVPNASSDLSVTTKCKNITPILMARGLGMESGRLKTYAVKIKSSGSKTGYVEYKGSFKIDLSVGKGPNYYKEVERLQMDKLLDSNPLPTAKLNNTSLEAQLLTEMNNQGFEEQFKRTYIQKDWQLFKPILQEPYREMKASFTYTTSDGKCGWQTYSFRSFKNTSGGWTKPQKWGGADQRERISCKKIK